MSSDCAPPLACASDYRCRNLCATNADCNVYGAKGRVCAKDANGVDYCANPNEVMNGTLTAAPPMGAPDATVIEPSSSGISSSGSSSGASSGASSGSSGASSGDAGGATRATRAELRALRSSPHRLAVASELVPLSEIYENIDLVAPEGIEEPSRYPPEVKVPKRS
jgi:hypothetical protein